MGSAVQGTRRPTAAERRSRILHAAAEVFFEHGFSATSIDMIIERTGGSKRAIYNEFGNKEALFAALVTEFAEQALASLEVGDGTAEQDLRSTLLHFAQGLVAIYASRELIGVYRAIVTEAYRFPRLAVAFFDNGPGRAARELRSLLEAAVARGDLAPLDTAVAADHFVGMIRDNLHLQLVLGLRDTPDPQELRRRAAVAVDIFLGGVAPGPMSIAGRKVGRRRRTGGEKSNRQPE